MRFRTATASLILAALALAPVPAPAAVSAADSALLAAVGRTYGSLQRYLFEGTIDVRITAPNGNQEQQVAFMVAATEDGKLRDHVDNPLVGGTFVSDGKETWVYNAGLGQWMRKTGTARNVLAALGMRGIAGALVARLGGIAGGVQAVRRLPDEPLEVNGARRACDVLEVTYAPLTNDPRIKESPRTYWIDKQTRLVLRQRTPVEAEAPQLGGRIQQVEVISFHRAELQPAFADSMWVFRAPPGAKQVEQFEAPAMGMASPMDGTAAANFALRDLAGKSHSLTALKGKVVLLDFWATWCGPCRITMPRIAKIHQEYKARGVEVLSINVGEPIQKARDYMKKNGYTFTTLLDGDRKVATEYKVNGIPTLVVVDRKGAISSYLVGAHSEETLREALAKAGVE